MGGDNERRFGGRVISCSAKNRKEYPKRPLLRRHYLRRSGGVNEGCGAVLPVLPVTTQGRHRKVSDVARDTHAGFGIRLVSFCMQAKVH